jgi:hypothetical protein
MMEHCKTCKHWDGVRANEYGGLPGSGSCTAASQIWDVTEYYPPDYEKLRLRPGHAGLLCFVADGSAYSAELITMSDFGCVLHESA